MLAQSQERMYQEDAGKINEPTDIQNKEDKGGNVT